MLSGGSRPQPGQQNAFLVKTDENKRHQSRGAAAGFAPRGSTSPVLDLYNWDPLSTHRCCHPAW